MTERDYEIMVASLVVKPIGSNLCQSECTTLELDNNGGGMFVSINQRRAT